MRKNYKKNFLILGLGNEILKDDGIGIFAVRSLKDKVGKNVDLEESSESGLALLDIILPYKRVLIIDSIRKKEEEPGTIYEFDMKDLSVSPSPSPHYLGLPLSLLLARKLSFKIPETIKILAVEIGHPIKIGEGLSPGIKKVIPALIKRAVEIINEWKKLF